MYLDIKEVAEINNPSIDEINLRIARAFLRQRYPLSLEGVGLHRQVGIFVSHGRIPRKFAKLLPTVENPHSEFFADFDLTPEQESEVFGWKLSTIQSHSGCTHQCIQCYKDAPKRLTFMPFAAIVKIAIKKREYERLGANEWKAWIEHLQKNGVVDLYKFPIRDFLKRSTRSELVSFLKILLREWEKFSPKVLQLHVPFNESLPVGVLRKLCLHSVPINLGSFIRCVFTYEGNDPLEYRDPCFLHTDGSPADFGDVFDVLSQTGLRPISITTAGWFSEDKLACRAIRKVMDICRKEPFVDSRDHRISISTGERHFKSNPDQYLRELDRMLRESASLKPKINLYYNLNDSKDRCLMFNLADQIEKFLKEEVGTKNKILVSHLSCLRGRAISLRNNESWTEEGDWDPDNNVDGIHIRPNGEVLKKSDFFWGTRRTKNGRISHEIQTPKGSDPEPTGIWLYHLKE